MKPFFQLITLLVLFISGFTNQLLSQSASRIPNSPYPVSTRPDTLCLVNIGNFTLSQQFTTVTLQGILAVTKPRIMVQRGNLNLQTDLSKNYGIVYDSSYFNDFTGLVTHFAPHINGYLLCKVNSASANVAITACRFFNAIGVTPADTAVVNSLGLTQLYDMTGKDQHWAFDTFQPMLSKRIISYQDTGKCSFLSDYSIMAGALHYWDATFNNFSDTIYNNLLINSVMMGWGPDEHSTVLQCSQHGVMVNASDWSANLSVYSNMDVPLAQHVVSPDTVIIPGTHTVCFVMTDGDNIQWVGGDFGTSPSWYGSPHRGIANVGWTISPALSELAPTMMKSFYDSATSTPTGRDYFIASASGMGYFYPDAFKNLDSAAAITSRMMQKADLHILNIIGNSFNDSLFEPYLKQSNIDAIFYYDYSNYANLGGRSTCANDKPVISARGNLWTYPWVPQVIAQFVNSFPKDPHSSAGYSLVDVNVWSNNVDSIISSINLFDSTIRVVTPDAFVKLFRAGVTCDTVSGIAALKENNVQLLVYPNPSDGETKVYLTLTQEVSADLTLYDMLGHPVRQLYSGLQSEGPHQFTINTLGLSAGMYYLCFKSNTISVSKKLIVVK